MKLFSLLAVLGLASATDCDDCVGNSKHWSITIKGTAITNACVDTCTPSNDPRMVVICPATCADHPMINLDDQATFTQAGDVKTSDPCLAVNDKCEECLKIAATNGCSYCENTEHKAGCLPSMLKLSMEGLTPINKCSPDTGSASIMASFAAVATVIAAWII